MKSDNPSTQPKTEGTRQSPSDWWFWAGPKDYRVIGDEEKYSGIFIAIFMNLLVIGFFFWTIWRLECGVDCLFPEMILYNNTGGEITLSLGNDEPVIVARESMGRVSQPMAYSFLRRKYHKSFRIRTKNRTWSYDVVEPPSDYEKPVNVMADALVAERVRTAKRIVFNAMFMGSSFVELSHQADLWTEIRTHNSHSVAAAILALDDRMPTPSLD